MAKLSPVALGKADREDNKPRSEMTKEERERHDQDEDDRKRGEPIKKRMQDLAYFRHMPQLEQAAFVRKHGWPMDEEKGEVIAGLSPALAAEILALGRDGYVPNSVEYWRVRRVLVSRLMATAKG